MKNSKKLLLNTSIYNTYKVNAITANKPYKKYKYVIKTKCKRDAQRIIFKLHKENKALPVIGWIGSRRINPDEMLKYKTSHNFKILKTITNYAEATMWRNPPQIEDNYEKNIISINYSSYLNATSS